jgi:hypothetical protein
VSSGFHPDDEQQRQRDNRRNGRPRDFSDLAASAATQPAAFELETFLPASLDIGTAESATYRHIETFDTTELGIVRVALRVVFDFSWVLTSGEDVRVTWSLRRVTGGVSTEIDAFSFRFEADSPGWTFGGTEDRTFQALDEVPGEGTHRYEVGWSIAITNTPTGTITPVYQRAQPVEYRQGA